MKDIVMKGTQVPIEKLVLIKQEQQAWGDACDYVVKKEDMPEKGDAYIMQFKTYSHQPKKIYRQEDGTGKIHLFWSIGD